MIPPRPEDNGEQPSGKRRGGRREPGSLGAALKQSVGPLMRQFRKFTAMRVCLEVLPKEIMDAKLAVPFDVRRAPSLDSAGGLDDVNTMYFYVASKTVKSVLERRKRRLIKAVNERLEFAFVEEVRYEEVSAQKIERQLNILALTPD